MYELHHNLPFLSKRMKIGKGEKPESNLYDRKNYANKKFKTSIKLQLVLQKVHRVIRFKQKAKLKPYINMDTELRKKTVLV